MLAQRIAHGAEGLEDVGVVGFAADDEQHIGLREPVLEADARDLLHLLVRRVAAEVGGDDRGLAEHLGDQRVGAAAEGRREDGAVLVDDEDVGLALVGAELIDLVLEVGGVGGEQGSDRSRRCQRGSSRSKPHLKSQATGVRRPSRPDRHADRVQLERRHAVVVQQLPQLRQVLHQRRDDLLRRADVGQRVGNDEGLQSGECIEGDVGDRFLVELLDVDAADVRERHGRRAEGGGIR